MGVLIDSANVTFAAGQTNSNAFNCTCGASDNRLLVLAAVWSATLTPPTVSTYNSVALTYLGSGNDGNVSTVFWYYMNSPSTGAAHSVLITFGGSISASLVVAIPISGVDLTRAPVLGVNSGDSSYSSSTDTCTTTGGGANDLYVAGTMAGQSLTSTGSTQSPVIANQNGINGNVSGACASIPGSSAGNFGWSLSAPSEWDALGVTVYAPANTSIGWVT